MADHWTLIRRRAAPGLALLAVLSLSVIARVAGAQEAKPVPSDSAARAASDDMLAMDKLAGAYAAHLTGDFVVTLQGGRLLLKIPLLPPAPLVSLGGSRYQPDHPQFKGWSATFRPGTFAPRSIEMHIVQPDGQGVFPRRETGPLNPDLAEYRSLIGHYTAGKDKAEIMVLSGGLALYEHGSPAFPLNPVGRDVFIMASAPGAGEFRVSLKREGGDVLGFVLRQPSQTAEYVKAGAVQTLSSDQIRLKAIEALGGEAALRARKSLVEDFEFDLSGLTGTGRMRWRAPFSTSLDVTLVAPGDAKSRISIRGIFDGTKGQMIVSGKAPRRYEQSDIDWDLAASPQEPLLWSRIYKSVTVLGPKRFDERDCIAVVKTFQSGRTITEYYDAATFLSAGIEGLKRNDEGREEPAVQLRRDWRTVGGIKRPFTLVIREGSTEGTLRTTSSRWDLPIADSFFAVRDTPPPKGKAK